MSILHHDIDERRYWDVIYAQPLPYWQSTLDVIRARHSLSGDAWERFSLGRNIVFAFGHTVVKLSPPFWVDEVPREMDALRFVHSRLPIDTPQPIASGDLAGWRYLVQSRLPGVQLRSIWNTLDGRAKESLAHQHGELMAALHAFPAQDAPPSLAFDWTGMLAYQRASCARDMRQAGVDAALLEDLDAYLEHAWPDLAADREIVLVHGDLDAVNLLAKPDGAGWQICGLVDWGDVKLGSRAHEFISPRVHMYRREHGLLPHWYAGYGLSGYRIGEALARNLMARTMLYYASEWGPIQSQMPVAGSCRRWAELAACMWQEDPGACQSTSVVDSPT